jgi:hypothetical protein
MKNIKSFNDFTMFENVVTSSINLNKINDYISNPLFNKKVIDIMDSIPLNIRRKIEDYYNSKEIIDIDKISYYINKYNLFDKIKKLYDKGITSFKDIYNKIVNIFSSSNESLISTLTIIIIISIIIAFIGFGLYYTIIGRSDKGMLGDSQVGITMLITGILITLSVLYFSHKEDKMNVKINNKIEEIQVTQNNDNLNIEIL